MRATTSQVAGSVYPPAQLVAILGMVVVPVVTAALEAGRTAVVDPALCGLLASQVLALPAMLARDGGDDGGGVADGRPDALHVELLRLITAISKHAAAMWGHHMKGLMTYLWRAMRSDNSAVVTHAQLAFSTLQLSVPFSEDVVTRLMVHVLRTRDVDTRKSPLVRDAMDFCLRIFLTKPHDGVAHTPTATSSSSGSAAAALPLPLPIPPTPTAGGSGGPKWVRFLRKVIAEEVAAGNHLVHVWQAILRHADALYPMRAQLVPSMLQSMQKLGNSASQSSEIRRLSLDLAGAMIAWEARRKAEAGGQGGGGGGGQAGPLLGEWRRVGKGGGR